MLYLTRGGQAIVCNRAQDDLDLNIAATGVELRNGVSPQRPTLPVLDLLSG